MDHLQQIEWLKDRLKRSLPGKEAQERMTGRVLPMPDKIPDNARPSAVLGLLFPSGDVLTMLLIRRTSDGRAHSGQVSFPGGRYETADGDLVTTALREANEEVGIISSDVTIIGALSPLYIPVSNFQVYPFIGFTEKKPEYILSESEVDSIIEIPLDELLHPERKTRVEVTSPADKTFIREVPAYKLQDGTIIWGATAMIISELQVVLEEFT